MYTQTDDHQNRRDQSDHHSSALSDANSNHQSTPPPQPQPPNNASPTHGYPPTMGCPPQMYPGYSPPPPQGYNQYPYTQAPPASYNNDQGNYASSSSPQHGRRSGFVRGVVAALIILIVLSCIVSLITWLVLRPELPVFHVNDMSVYNFNTSSTPFTATWDANVTVENPNHKLKVYFDRILGAIYYKERDALRSSWVNPILMETNSKATLHVIISTNGSAEDAVPIWVAQEMGKDRSGTGSVSFDLRFRVWATFKSGSWWTRNSVMGVLCQGLKIDFVGASRNGALAPARRDDCQVYG